MEDLKKWRSMGMTLAEISDRMGRSVDSLFGVIRRTKMHRMSDGKYPVNRWSRLKVNVKDYPPIDKLLAHVIRGNELLRDLDPREREVYPEYPTDKWVGVVVQGDWHFDHYKSDIPAIIKDLEEIGKHDDVFYVFNGDVGEWSDIRFKGYNLPNIVVPLELRYEIIYHMAEKIPNLLAVVAGCHDDWLKNRGCFDIIGSLQKKRNALGLPTYYLGYGGFINFTVGQCVYRIAAFHKFGCESRVNDFHPCLKFLREMDYNADIVCISHRHDKCGIAYHYYQFKPRLFVRCGSHQYLTDYAWKEGFGGAINKTPMFLLNGAKKEFRACVDYRQGLAELRLLNK
jgi:hypothetical protein